MTPKQRRPRRGDVELDLHRHTAAQASDRLYRVLARHQGQNGLVLAVIHGVGEGILAGVVREIVANDPRVASFERDPVNPGVTRVLLNAKRIDGLTGARGGFLDLPIPPVRRRTRR